MRIERLERHSLFFVAIFLMVAIGAASVPLAAHATALPDLIITTGVSPTSAAVGVPVRFSATVKNQGPVGTGSSYPVRFQKANDANGTGAFWLGVATVSSTGPGVSKTATMDTGYAPPSSSTFYLRACANVALNGNFYLAESDTTNNCGVWTAINPVPTVSFSASLYSIPNGDTSRLTWSATDAFSCTGTNFSTGGSVSSFVDVSPTSDTTYSITCTNSVGVSSPSQDVTVTVRYPDLTASTVTPLNATAGTAATFSSTISNNSATAGAAAGPFTDVLQRATDASGANTADIATYQTGQLAPNATSTASFSYTFPSSDAGTARFLRVCADKSSQADTGVITESDESNNCSNWTSIYVSATPVNLRPTIGNSSVTVLTPVPLAGQSTNLSASFSNYGSSAIVRSFPDLFEVYPGTTPPSTFAQITGSGGVVQVTADGLGANGASTITASYTFPYAGNWQVRACADTNTLNNANTTDSRGVVTESSDTDNCGDWRTVVVNTPWAVLSANGQSSITVLAGSPVQLSWSSGYATSCTGTNFSTGGSTDNSVTVNPTTDTTYSIRCENSTSPPGTSSVQVQVITANLSLSASPLIVRRGGQTLLQWSVGMSLLSPHTCTIKDQDGTTISSFSSSNSLDTGSAMTAVPSASTYTLSCSFGSLVSTTNAKVRVAPDYKEF